MGHRVQQSKVRSVRFDGVKFAGTVWLDEAEFTKDASFDDATFAHAVPPELANFVRTTITQTRPLAMTHHLILLAAADETHRTSHMDD
ncbi:pentapeptide repeat-containing protein [Kibdelosporangium aridum]|uniref:pentapeptide repeat-containing protein n=1 Tax=Kibdelosporangium aridum TaxID=2030 RepID=UPI001179C062|nr:pentapeptide repeat-containing protein [Kibdelosporangium aridum]